MIEKLRAALAALDELARLGNGGIFGNSICNTIARRALPDLKAVIAEMEAGEPVAIAEGRNIFWIAGKEPNNDEFDKFLYDHPQPKSESDAIKWAVSRWIAEVANRPLKNVHRRSLDDTWRQVIRHFGEDDTKVLPLKTHDEMVANDIRNSRTNDAAAQPKAEPVHTAIDVTIDDEEALGFIRDMVVQDDGELTPVRLLYGAGHSGYGLYIASADYPEEGAFMISSTVAQPKAEPNLQMSDAMRDFITGMSVSVDVSTGEDDAYHRYFGVVDIVQDDVSDKHCVTLLVQNATPNFEVQPKAESTQGPVYTREQHYALLDKAVENVRQECLVKTVTMRCKGFDLALNVIDAYSGHILVAEAAAPQAKPLQSCATCSHFKKDISTGVSAYEMTCFECSQYYANFYEAAHEIGGDK